MATKPLVVDNISMSGSSETKTTYNTSSSFPHTTVSQLAVRSMCLSFFIIIGFVGNCLIIACIVTSRRLRRNSLNLLMVSFASLNIVDCIANMPIILGTTVTEQWQYDTFMCQFNSCIMHLVCILTYLHLLLMAFDRTVAVYDPPRYKEKLTKVRISVVIGSTWATGFIISIPVLSGTIASTLNGSLYLCTIELGTTILYITIVSVCCFILPTILMIVCFVLIVKWGIQEKLKAHTMLNEHQYTDTLIQDPIWKQIRGAVYVAVLFGLWCVLEGPYLLVQYTELYANSAELYTGSTQTPFKYPWELNMAFLWINLSFVMVLPLVTFYFRKEVWQKLKDLILCRKSNLVVDSSPRDRSKSRRRSRKKEELDEHEKKRIDRLFEKSKVPDPPTVNPNASFNAPVLFATTTGLRVHDNAEENEDDTEDEEHLKNSHESYFFADITSKSNTLKVLKSKNCDVEGSTEGLRSETDDTSDYDSHNESIDPFSVTMESGRKHGRSQSVVEGRKYRTNSATEEDTQQLSQSLGSENLRKVKEEAFRELPKAENIDETPKKRKPKSSKVTKIELLVDVHENNNADPEQYERTSNDSGRGTSEREKRKNARPKIEITASTNDDEAAPQSEKNTSATPPVTPTKRVKKRKKEPKEQKDQVFELNSMHTNTEEVVDKTDKIDSKKKSEKPPPRLNPIESNKKSSSPRLTTKTNGGLNNNKTSPDPKRKTSISNGKGPVNGGSLVHDNKNIQNGGPPTKRPNVKRESKDPLLDMNDPDAMDILELQESVMLDNKSTKQYKRRGRSSSSQELISKNDSPRD